MEGGKTTSGGRNYPQKQETNFNFVQSVTRTLIYSEGNQDPSINVTGSKSHPVYPNGFPDAAMVARRLIILRVHSEGSATVRAGGNFHKGLFCFMYHTQNPALHTQQLRSGSYAARNCH